MGWQGLCQDEKKPKGRLSIRHNVQSQTGQTTVRDTSGKPARRADGLVLQCSDVCPCSRTEAEERRSCPAGRYGKVPHTARRAVLLSSERQGGPCAEHGAGQHSQVNSPLNTKAFLDAGVSPHTHSAAAARLSPQELPEHCRCALRSPLSALRKTEPRPASL